MIASQNNIPKLRFPEFGDGWEIKKLGEIFKISAGGDIGIENVSEIKTNIYQYPIYANAEKRKGFYGYSDIYKIEENVVTVAGRGVNIGIAHARNHKFYPIVRLLVLKPTNQENIYFFEYQINNLNLLKESTGVPQLTAPQISGYSISFPSLPEQQKIATFLSTVDEKLQAIKKKKSLLETYKKGVMQKLFSQQIRFKDDDGNDFEDWEMMKLGEICKITIGEFVIKTKQNPNGKYPVFNGGKTYTGLYDEFNNEGNKIIISARGANAGFVNFQSEKYWAGNSCYSISVKDEKIYSIKYFFFYIKMFENRFLENQQAANIPSVSKKDTEMFEIEIPFLPEQIKIANFLTAIDEKITKVDFQIKQMELWKKGLLQQMFV